MSDRLAQLQLALRLLLFRGRYDVVVTGRYGEMFALLQSLLPFKRPHVLLDVEWFPARRGNWRNRLNLWTQRRIASGAQVIQVFCQIAADNYAVHFGIDKSRFYWIPYCCETFAPEPQQSAANFILASGVHHRDYKTLFAAVDGLPIEIRIVAPTSAFAGLKLPPNVRVLGHLAPESYASVVAASHFIVLSLLPDVMRPAGVITYVTAMQAGKCVVVNDRPGAGSYIEHGKTGYLVDAADPTALRKQICALLDSPEAVARVGRQAAYEARRKFSPEAYFAAVLEAARQASATSTARGT